MGEFSKPKVLIDKEEYDYLKNLENQEYEIEKRIADGILPYQIAFGAIFKKAVTTAVNIVEFAITPIPTDLFWKILKEEHNLVVTGSKEHNGITIPIVSPLNPPSNEEA